MSAMQKVKDALLKAGFSGENSRECAEGGEKTPRSPHVAMDFVRRALDAAAPWWQSQGAEPKNGERIVNSPVEKETRPTALGAGRHMEAMQRKAGSRPPIGELPDTPKGMADDEAITEDALVMDAEAASAELKQMQSELDKHDQQYHGGAYKGGACKLRDKVAKAAKNLGMQNNVTQGLVGAKKGAAGAGGAGGTEEVETKEDVSVTETIDPNAQKAGAGGGAGGAGGGEAEAPEVPDEAEKAFKDKVASIKAKYKEARKAAEKAKDNAKVNRLVNGYVKQMQAARMEYLTNALNMSPAEAGACTEIAQKVDEGSPEAKKVVEELAQNPNLTDQQKAAVEVVQEGNEESDAGETPAPEAAGSPETAAPAEGSASPAAEPTDAQFADELKQLAPKHTQMIDDLSQKFEGLNTSLNDDQKKKFWELNEGGDEEAFYNFLMMPEVGFSEEEVSALRDLTDAYRAANPNDYPEYAEQHKHDELLARVKKADRRLNNDVKRGKLSGIKNRLEFKGFSNDEIEQYMDAMGLTEDQKFAVMNDLPVPPKVPTPEEMAQRKAEQAVKEKMDAYHKAHDQASKDKKLDDPETAQKLNDLLKEAMEAQKAAKTPAPAAPTSAPAKEATAPADGTASAETGAGGVTEGGNASTPTAKATKEEVAAQKPDDPITEGTTPEDHAKVCKANPKSNCPFLKAHMAPEALAALDKPEGAQPAATGETTAPASATGETAAPATGTAQPAAEPTEGAVPPESSGGETSPAAETTEPSTETASPAPASEAPTAAPTPLPAGPAEPLPEYKVPRVNGQEVELSVEEQKHLDDLRNAYAREPSAEKRAEIEAEYNQFTADLDAQAAMLQAQADVEKDARAQEMEKKQPGFIQNMKDFFGGLLKTLKGDKPVGFEIDPERRRKLGLPETGTIRQSEYRAAAARATARENARKAEEAKKAKEEAEARDSEYRTPLPVTDGIKLADASMLDPVPPTTETDKEAEDVAKRIARKIADAGEVKGMSTTVGDTATTVELTVGDNFNIKKAQGMLANLGLASGATVTSVMPVKGKPNTVAVQFTNNKARVVPFAAIVGSDEWKKESAKTGIPVVVGRDVRNRPIVKNLAKMPHTLITGATGSGKSVCLQSLIHSSQMAKTPKQLRQVCIDGKGQEFGSQEGSPYNLFPVKPGMTEPKDAAKMLDSLVNIMKERQQKCARYKDLDAYNASQSESDQLPYVVTYIDELATYTKDPEYGKQITDALDQLLAKGRSLGMNFVLSTQRGDVDSVAGKLKANIPGRMTFKAAPDDAKASDEAKGLGGYGDMIMEDGKGEKVRGRGAWISDRESEAIENHYKKQMPTKKNTPKPPSDPNAPQPVPKDKRSSPTHIANMPDGMEIHKGDGGRLIFKHGGRQYKQVQRRTKDGQVKNFWKLADGSDNRLYVLKKPSPPPAS